jgi:hypothetical protein
MRQVQRESWRICFIYASSYVPLEPKGKTYRRI